MKQKPIKIGYKIFGLAERGYLYSFRFTTPPKSEGDEEGITHGVKERPQVNGIPLSKCSQTVLDLCFDLPYAVRKFILYTDNYFSNIRLFKVL